MVFARVAKFHFKKGRFEDGFAAVDLALNKLARESKGFRGFVSLISEEEKDLASVMTIWEDREAMVASEKEVFFPAVDKIKESFESAPEIEHFRVFSTEMFSRNIRR